MKPQTASRHQLPLKPHRRTQETSDAIAFYASETGFGFSDSGCNITKQRHISKTAWKTTEDLHTKVDDVHHVARLSRVKSAQFCQIALRRIPATYTDKTAGKKTFILVAHGPKLYCTYIPLKTKKPLQTTANSLTLKKLFLHSILALAHLHQPLLTLPRPNWSTPAKKP